MIFDQILKALGYLFISMILFSIWKQSYDNSKMGKTKMVLWKGFLLCGGLALFASLVLGNPTCEQLSDPVYGGCEQYSNDGYKPTTEERAAHFAYFLTLLYLPVIFGAVNGYKAQHLTYNE